MPGLYDSARRYAKLWKDTNRHRQRPAYVPLDFGKGEAFQFDWSEETIEIGGVCQKLQVAQVPALLQPDAFLRGLRRKSIVISRSLRMVEMTMALFAIFHVNV